MKRGYVQPHQAGIFFVKEPMPKARIKLLIAPECWTSKTKNSGIIWKAENKPYYFSIKSAMLA